MNDDLKTMDLYDLSNELVQCGREKQIYGDSDRKCSRNINERIYAIKEEIMRRFYALEKMN